MGARRRQTRWAALLLLVPAARAATGSTIEHGYASIEGDGTNTPLTAARRADATPGSVAPGGSRRRRGRDVVRDVDCSRQGSSRERFGERSGADDLAGAAAATPRPGAKGESLERRTAQVTLSSGGTETNLLEIEDNGGTARRAEILSVCPGFAMSFKRTTHAVRRCKTLAGTVLARPRSGRRPQVRTW